MTDKPAGRWRKAALIAAVAVALLVLALIGGLPRVRARARLERETAQMAVPVVAVIQPKRAPAVRDLVLPASVRAYVEASIYARTTGYLKRWRFDIGARVKEGDLLAEIDTPEVNQQLRQARADLSTVEANLKLAQITAARYEDLLRSDSVSKQEADNATGDLAAKRALVRSSEANVKRLEDLQSFQKIYAPFSGVVTARNTDVGALIDAGARTELFHLAQPEQLRVYVNLPEAFIPSAQPGLTAELTVAQYPDRRFPGTLVRTAGAIDPTSRTLLVELRVDNPTGVLLPGAYAQIRFKLPNPAPTLLLPAGTLMFGTEGMRVAVVGADRRVALKQVTIGRDLGTEVEVVAGLKGDEAVVVNPSDSLTQGQAVRTAAGPDGAGAGSAPAP